MAKEMGGSCPLKTEMWGIKCLVNHVKKLE